MMTTELVLLLGLFAFITGGVFFGDKGPISVFGRSGPRLAARIEKEVTVGREFKVGNKGASQKWFPPTNGGAPTGKL